MVTNLRCATARVCSALSLAAALFATAQAQAQADTKAPDKVTGPQPDGARAFQPDTPAVGAPHLSHAPLSVVPAGEALSVKADIVFPERTRRALFVYRNAKDNTFREVPFQRASDGPYVAIVPAAEVQAPWLAYTIEIEDLQGRRNTQFATRAAPHLVQVPDDLMDLREAALSERLDHRRSVFSTSAESVSFGSSVAEFRDPNTGIVNQETLHDSYFRIEGAYTYRPLRVITEFSVRIGVVRGKAPVPLRERLPGVPDSERFNVGLNYGAPTVRIRAHDAIHLEAELLTSVSEVGFALGGGGAILIGDPYGSKLTMGFESIQTFGTRFFSRVDVVATENVRVAPIVEVSNMPSADRYGVRLLGEVAFDLNKGFTVAARGGYQARDAESGGPAFGGTIAYAF